ncbi:MAG: glutamate 5-kinase [Peptoniphilaceae bacterium]|nr:glutamate 5-kinase [Peptoniphilaceae bacterium]MDY6085473.1 glutamate 5-kinase [Peptoniphilaceae bacterium]
MSKRECWLGRTPQDVIAQSRKIVVKIGSSTLAHEDGAVNREFLESLAKSVDALRALGKQVVLVSSGARVAGVSRIGKWSRKEDTNYKQALCAIGQVELMTAYSEIFSAHELFVGQILLTRDDFGVKERSLNIRNTLFTLTDEGIIPIVNENDTVAVEEIKVGDNDSLSAHTAVLWNADCLILLSDIDGIYDQNPKTHPEAKLIEFIDNLDETLSHIDISGKSDFGTGGIETKISATREAMGYGIPVILANGSTPDILLQLSEGTAPSTLFTNAAGKPEAED